MELWYKRAAIILFILLCLFLGWCAFRPTVVTIHNHSSQKADSIVILVQNIRKVIRHVPANFTYTWYVPTDSLQHNGHDAMVSATVYLPGGVTEHGYWYTDLFAPSVPRNTIITLRKDGTVSVLDGDLY